MKVDAIYKSHLKIEGQPNSRIQGETMAKAAHVEMQVANFGKSSKRQNGVKIIDRMYVTRVALSPAVKKKVVSIMQERLADSLDTYSQAKFAHWNVKGLNFYQLHLVFDSVAGTVFKQIDEIAERITQLGGVANGTVRQSAACSTLPEYSVEAIAGMDHVNALADALGHYCRSLREASDKIDDAGDEPTSDFFKQLVVDAEEQLYFLESHLEAGAVE